MDLNIKVFYLLNDFAKQSAIFDWFVIFFAEYFEFILIGIFLAFLFFSSFSRVQKKKIFRVSAISVIFSRGIITEIIRFFYHHPRPFVTYDIHQLIPENGYSFPSGHAAFFFALSCAIYFYNKRLGVIFFAASILMGIARVIAGVHYPFDILGGAIIGILTAYGVFCWFESKNKNTSR